MNLYNFILISLVSNLIGSSAAQRSSKVIKKCAKPVVRKEIRELSPAERTKLFTAMRKLMEPDNTSKDKLSKYEKFARIHDRADKFAHGRPAFYPWHRVFLRYFEMELQKIDPDVTLAYWDWSYDYKKPHKSEVLSDAFMGGNGDSRYGYVVKDGFFANITYNFPKKHNFRRRFDDEEGLNTVGELPGPDQLLPAIYEKRFSYFAHLIEEAHGGLHMNLGEYPADISTMYSPLDPLFWLHHTFIDVLWYKWQKTHPKANQYEGIRYRKQANPKERMRPFSITPEDVIDTEGEFLCYKYPDYPRNIVPFGEVGKSRSFILPLPQSNPLLSTFKGLSMEDIVKEVSKRGGKSRSLNKPKGPKKFKKPKSIKQAWIERENLDPLIVKENELLIEKFTDALNDIPDFQPLGRQDQ